MAQYTRQFSARNYPSPLRSTTTANATTTTTTTTVVLAT
jgi:hypothetical protein